MKQILFLMMALTVSCAGARLEEMSETYIDEVEQICLAEGEITTGQKDVIVDEYCRMIHKECDELSSGLSGSESAGRFRVVVANFLPVLCKTASGSPHASDKALIVKIIKKLDPSVQLLASASGPEEDVGCFESLLQSSLVLSFLGNPTITPAEMLCA
jgi:hypothetical protein